MKPNENWKNSKGNYVGVFVLFFFLCEYIFFCFVFLFLFLEQVQILRPSVSYLHNLLLNSSRFFMSLCEHGFVLFNVNDPFRKC